MCPCGCGKEDHSDNGSTASSGSGPGGLVNSFSLPSPPPNYQQVTLPNTPDLSPLKSQDSFEVPLDMSKTSPFYGVTMGSTGTMGSSSETPPPSPPENDRDKFRCLYLLVDAAVGQLEELERQKQQPGRVCAWIKKTESKQTKQSKQQKTAESKRSKEVNKHTVIYNKKVKQKTNPTPRLCSLNYFLKEALLILSYWQSWKTKTKKGQNEMVKWKV